MFQYGRADRRPLDAEPAVKSLLYKSCLIAVAAFAPFTLTAQSGGGDGVIKPPPGMCRIWVEGVKADKQPAPTDCASALKNKPTNGRVIFGDAKPAVTPARPPRGKKTPPDTGKGKGRRPGRGDTLSRGVN